MRLGRWLVSNHMMSQLLLDLLSDGRGPILLLWLLRHVLLQSHMHSGGLLLRHWLMMWLDLWLLLWDHRLLLLLLVCLFNTQLLLDLLCD